PRICRRRTALPKLKTPARRRCLTTSSSPLMLKNFAKTKCLFFPALVGLLLLGALSAFADSITVHLKNGDKISGKIISNTTNEVVLRHPVLGQLTIPAEQI